MEKNVIIGGGFTAGCACRCYQCTHDRGASLRLQRTTSTYAASRRSDPQRLIKYVSVPSIGEGQDAGNGIAHEVAAYDNVLVGGGYTCYLDTRTRWSSATASTAAIGMARQRRGRRLPRRCLPATRATPICSDAPTTMSRSRSASGEVPAHRSEPEPIPSDEEGTMGSSRYQREPEGDQRQARSC